MLQKCDGISGFAKVGAGKNIEEFKDKGLSMRQVSRLMGISFGLVSRTDPCVLSPVFYAGKEIFL